MTQEMSGGGPDSLFAETLVSEVSATGLDIVGTLPPLITRWVNNQRRLGRVSPDVLSEVEGTLQDDPLGALKLVVNEVGPGMVHRSMAQTVRTLRRDLRAGFSKDEEKRLVVGETPKTLTLGSECHRIAETLLVSENPLRDFPVNMDLVIEDSRVVAFREPPKEAAFVQLEFGGEGEEVVTGQIPKEIRLEYPIDVPEEIQSRTMWAINTAREKLLKVYVEYSKKFNDLPEKPSDIKKMLQDEQLKPLFMELMEVTQYLLGSKNGLSLVRWDGDTGIISAQNIDAFKAIDTLVLARLAVERFAGADFVEPNAAKLVEIQEGNMSIHFDHTVEDGQTIVKNQDVRSGRIDILCLSFKSEDDELKNLGLDLGLMQPIQSPNENEKQVATDNYRKILLRAVGGSRGEPNFKNLTPGNVVIAQRLLGYMEATVDSRTIGGDEVTWTAKDISRWKKKMDLKLMSENFGKSAGLPINKAVEMIEKKFKIHGRNLSILFRELYKLYGDRIFTDMTISVSDLKFPAGDAGWYSVFQSGNLPQNKDKHQVEGYLFKVASQLFSVYMQSKSKLISSKGEEFIKEKSPDRVMEIGEVVKFIRRFKLWQRLGGRILYQTPLRSIEFGAKLEKQSSLLVDQGRSAFRVNPEKNEERLFQIQVLRALRRILGPDVDQIPRVIKERKKVPDELAEVCIQDDGGRVFLCIDDLSNLVSERVGELEGAKIAQVATMFMDNKEADVFWIDNLKEGLPRLRIAVDQKGRFFIHGLTSGPVTGRLLSSRDFIHVDEDGEMLMEYYSGEIFTRLIKDWGYHNPVEVTDGGIAFPLSGSIDFESSGKILFPDGSLRDPIPGKPLVCSWNPMTGRWFLDPRLLEMAASSGGDKHDTVRLYNLVRRKFKGSRGLLCPIADHDNLDKKSRAAQWSFEHGYAHVICRNPECGVSIDISKAVGAKKKLIEVSIGPENYRVSDFREMTLERERLVSRAIDLSLVFASVDDTVSNYLVQKRGLSPNDVGPVGYVPPWFSKTLWNMAKNRTFQEIFAADGSTLMKDLSGVAGQLGVVDENKHFARSMDQLLERLGSLPGSVDSKISSLLSAETIKFMWDAGIIGWGSGFSGGVVMPLYWPRLAVPDDFIRSNVNVRGININGRDLFMGRGHWKVKLEAEGETSADGVWKEPTPAGIWIRDPKLFIESVQKYKTVYITEGIFNAVTLRRIAEVENIPEILDTGIATVGTGYKALYAFLRHLGVYGDKNYPKECLGIGVQNIILAPDFDSPGVGYFRKREFDLTQMFNGINIVPVQNVLPVDLGGAIPPYSHELFSRGGPLFKFKLDLNDLIQQHDPGWIPMDREGVDQSIEAKLDEISHILDLARVKYARTLE